ncbi:MAG: sigma-70 family RNA polymerase sigma factor [Herpetosiphon sp.]
MQQQTIQPAELVAWCQRTLPDDTRAFEALVVIYQQRVLTRAYRLMGNHHEAEDQAQEVFVKIFRNIQSLQEPATLPAWIDRITTRTCLDALAKQSRRPVVDSLVPEVGNEIQYADLSQLTPEETALRLELRRCLERALAGLESAARAALVLRDVDDRSYSEIATTLGLGLSAAKMRIHRARVAMSQLLDRFCPGVARETPDGLQSI